MTLLCTGRSVRTHLAHKQGIRGKGNGRRDARAVRLDSRTCARRNAEWQASKQSKKASKQKSKQNNKQTSNQTNFRSSQVVGMKVFDKRNAWRRRHHTTSMTANQPPTKNQSDVVTFCCSVPSLAGFKSGCQLAKFQSPEESDIAGGLETKFGFLVVSLKAKGVPQNVAILQAHWWTSCLSANLLPYWQTTPFAPEAFEPWSNFGAKLVTPRGDLYLEGILGTLQRGSCDPTATYCNSC